MVGAGNGDFAGLNRLPQGIQNLRMKLGQFVQKQHAMMGQRDLAWLGADAAAHQRGHGGGMMGRTKRAAVGQFAASQHARDRMDHGNFEQFLGRQGRQDGGQALGEHAFARSGRSVHQEVVATCGGDLQRALGAFLSLDVAQVRHGRAGAAQGGGGAARSPACRENGWRAESANGAPECRDRRRPRPLPARRQRGR